MNIGSMTALNSARKLERVAASPGLASVGE
jgi:hypothetical protein